MNAYWKYFQASWYFQLGLFSSSLLHPKWVVLFSCLDHSYRSSLLLLFKKSSWNLAVCPGFLFAFQIPYKIFGYLYHGFSLASLAFSFKDSTGPVPSAKSSLCVLLLNQDSAWSLAALSQLLFTFSLLFERLQLMFLWLSWGFLFPSSLFNEKL